MINPQDYTTHLSFAKNLAHQAGIVMLKYFHEDIAVEMKEDVTPLTIADTTINKLVVEAVAKVFPDYGLISEEGNGGSIESEYQWICDPIDGTIPYTVHFPTSMFSLALYRNKQPILGVMYDPYLDRMYWALTDGPAYMNDKIIEVKRGTFQKGDVAGLISIVSNKISCANWGLVAAQLNDREIRTHEIHSIVYMASSVARGDMKGVFAGSAMLWDRAATNIILQSAGGIIADENGNPINPFKTPKYLLISNGDTLPEMVELAKRLVKTDGIISP